MASSTQWTWVWASSQSWWWTRKPGMLQPMGLQTVGQDLVTELNWTETRLNIKSHLAWEFCVFITAATVFFSSVLWWAERSWGRTLIECPLKNASHSLCIWWYVYDTYFSNFHDGMKFYGAKSLILKNFCLFLPVLSDPVIAADCISDSLNHSINSQNKWLKLGGSFYSDFSFKLS